MKARVQKWGNSLALRIPKSFAVEAGLSEDIPVEVSLVDKKVVVEPISAERFLLEDLLRGVTKKNIHAEVKTGPAVGREVW